MTVLSLVGVYASIFSVRTYLAFKRLRIRVLRRTKSARRGKTGRMIFQLVARRDVRVEKLSFVLVGIRQKIRPGRSPGRVKRDYLETRESVLERNIDLLKGGKRKLEGRIEIPAGAIPTSTDYHDQVCWILGIVAELPGWPDAEVAREIIVR